MSSSAKQPLKFIASSSIGEDASPSSLFLASPLSPSSSSSMSESKLCSHLSRTSLLWTVSPCINSSASVASTYSIGNRIIASSSGRAIIWSVGHVVSNSAAFEQPKTTLCLGRISPSSSPASVSVLVVLSSAAVGLPFLGVNIPPFLSGVSKASVAATVSPPPLPCPRAGLACISLPNRSESIGVAPSTTPPADSFRDERQDFEGGALEALQLPCSG
mmetsp:Transcript_7473/g.17782  ORF Transcript_7473/g.17782 Transcript_7473/m.17782 type:complete len:217 (+) Transcript_7473:1839-2489(+)